MSCLGWLLIVLGLPCLLGYYIGGRKSTSWKNLGFIMLVAGVLIIYVSASVGY
jgi:hypothetical protein